MTLLVVRSPQELGQVSDKLAKDDVVVLASGADTFVELNQRKVSYQRVSQFHRTGHLYLTSVKSQANDISQGFVDQLPINKLTHPVVSVPQFIHRNAKYFIFNLLLSLDMARRTVNKFKPQSVIVSNRLTEQLLRTTHQASFSLYNQALILWCQQKNIPVHYIGKKTYHYHYLQLVVKLNQLLVEVMVNAVRSLLTSLKSSSSSRSKKAAILLSASQHKLINLKSLIKLLSKHNNIITAGKLAPQDLKQVRRGWNFHPINEMIKMLSGRDLLHNTIFSLSIFLRYLLVNPLLKREYFKRALGIDAWSLLGPTMSHFFSLAVFDIHRSYLYAKSLFETHRFSFLLLPNAMSPFNTAVASLAAYYHVPYGLIIHGAQGSTFFDYNFLPTDQLFVWGDYQKRLISKDLPSVTCYVTGHPDLDRYQLIVKQQPPKKIKIRKYYSILILTTQDQFIQKPNDEILLDVLENLNKMKDYPVRVTVKGHPSEVQSNVKSVIDSIASYPVSFSSQNTDRLISKHDIVITQSTSAGVLAIVWHKPTVYLNIDEYKDYLPFAKEKAAIGVYRLNQLIPAIKFLINKPDALRKGQDRFINDFCYRVDGKSSQRVIAQINQLMSVRMNP
jgi:hypothetical protein